MGFTGRNDGFSCVDANNIIDLNLFLQDYAIVLNAPVA